MKSRGRGHELSWALCVPTRNRPVTLAACLAAAAAQDPPPSEIIVVDSSDPELRSQTFVDEQLARRNPGIRVVYECTEVGSLTRQRQRSIALATSDVVFTFDDDTIMFPHAAAEILAVYQADPCQRVVGVEATEWRGPPAGVEVDDSADPLELEANDLDPSMGWLRLHYQRVLGAALMFDPRTGFIPYDDDYPKHDIPPAVAALDSYSVPLLLGYRMTFRRSAICDLQHEHEFLAYTPIEDFDLSYRASRRGALVCSQRAGVYHHRARAGRLTRCELEAKSQLNLALVVRRHAVVLGRAQRRYVLRSCHRTLAWFARDIARKRWTFTTTRGCISGTREGLKVLAAGDERFADVYARLQRRYLL